MVAQFYMIQKDGRQACRSKKKKNTVTRIHVDTHPAAPCSVFGREASLLYFIPGIRERWRTQLWLRDQIE